MDGFMCMFNKSCREEKSKEIVENMSNEEKSYEEIYSKSNLNSPLDR